MPIPPPLSIRKFSSVVFFERIIKQEFKSEKGYPCWVQSSDWPIGADGKPMTYVKKGKRIGSIHRWIFRDESTGELTTVEQYD